MTAILTVTGLVFGVLIGWSAKSAWLWSYVHVKVAENGHYIIYFGPCIVGRATNEEEAIARSTRLVYALQGRRMPAERNDQGLN